jgi:hypothetical protein
MERDILILTVYFICMGYVVYQMALSIEADLEDQVTLLPDAAHLENAVRSQLVRQGFAEQAVEILPAGPPPLKGAMTLRLAMPEPKSLGPSDSNQDSTGHILVQVLPEGRHPLKPLPGLTVQVVNQSQAIQINVDWDRSSITRLGQDIRRVIRQTPGMRLDLGSPQVTSAVNPNQFLSTAITSEDCFGRNPDTQVLQVAAPLVDIPRVAGLKVANYSLDLLVQLVPFAGRGGRPVLLLLPFRYRVQLLPDRAAIPLVNWILKR